MKVACIILSCLIGIAIMAVCVMVKFATDVTMDERKRELTPGGGVFTLTRSMGVITLSDNNSAIAERFPYVAAIIRNSSTSWSFSCFASIILVKWVVTSGHCRKHGATHRVLLYHDFSRNVSLTYPILFWRLHEKFNNSNPTPKYDIAVAKLSVEEFRFVIKSAVFDDRRVLDIEASIWKTVQTMDRKLYLTNDFERYEMKIATPGACFETYGVELDDSLICVDLSEHEVCFVQEFGPLYLMDKIIGVLAISPRDCDVKTAIFTNVSFYANWILKSTHTTYYG